jgi:hypothetical protein
MRALARSTARRVRELEAEHVIMFGGYGLVTVVGHEMTPGVMAFAYLSVAVVHVVHVRTKPGRKDKGDNE